MPTTNEAKQLDDDIVAFTPSRLVIRPRAASTPRLWLLRFVQLPLAYAAPHNCLQYFTDQNGE